MRRCRGWWALLGRRWALCRWGARMLWRGILDCRSIQCGLRLSNCVGDRRWSRWGRWSLREGAGYFAVMAGAGPDGTLVYELGSERKSGWGRLAYYVHAARLFATRRFRPFLVEYVEAGTGRTAKERAVCAMAVRVKSLGGVFGRITGRGSAEGRLRLLVVRPPAVVSLPVWFVCGWLGLERVNPLMKMVEVSEFSCTALTNPKPHFEADGEWLGRLPMRVSVAPDALRVRLPAGRDGRTSFTR